MWPVDSGRTAARTCSSSSFWGVESEGRFAAWPAFALACSGFGYCLCTCLQSGLCVLGAIDLSFKNPAHGSMPVLDLAKTLEKREEKWETVNVYVCASACTWRVMQQASRVGLNTLCEKTLTSFFLLWEKLFFHMSFSFGLDSGADCSEQSP